MIDNHEADPESPFAGIAIGSIVTRFGEVAKRVHHCTFAGARPLWFDPRHHANQGAAHLNGFSVYWEAEMNEQLRDEEHPFEGEVAANAIHITQLSLIL